MPVYQGKVLPEWIDVNDHMNVAYYVLAFDLGVDRLWEQFGITDEYMRDRRGSTFAVESHITYLNELLEGEPYIVTSQLLGFDEKRIHQFMRLYHAQSNALAATAEWMNLHVSLDSRRVCPWPDDILDHILEFAERQTDRQWPLQAGRRMGIKQPLFSLRSGE
jgi:acyl-CoA thioester hydrolase